MGTEGQHDGVVAGRGLQLEIERPAELLAEGEAQPAVDASAVGGVDDELHTAGVVEEPLQHQALLGGRDAEGGSGHGQVVDDHGGRRVIDARRLDQPPPGAVGIAGDEVLVDAAPQLRHLLGQLCGPSRSLPQPERDRRRRVTCIPHPDDAGLHLADLPRVGAEQEDVTRHRFHGPVLVDGADQGVVGLGHDPVVAGLGDGASRGDGRQPGALASPELAIHRVVVEVGAPATSTRLDAVRDQPDHLVEPGPVELDVRRRPSHQLVQLAGRPLLGRHLGDDLLGGDVEGETRQLDGVETARPHGHQQRAALDQLVARQREQPSLGRSRPAVVGAADPLQEGGDAAWRADLAYELDRPDVDAQLERRGRHQGLEVTRPQPGLHPVAAFLREAAVVGCHHVVAQVLPQLMCQALGEPTGVDEHEGGAVLADQHGDALEHIGQLLGRRHRLQLPLGQLESQVEIPLMADIDHRWQRAVTDEQAAHRFDRALGGRQPDAHRAPVAHRLEPLQAQRQVGTTLVAGDGVNLVDDHRVNGAQHLSSAVARYQQVERLRRGNDEAGWAAHHDGSLRAGGVARAHPHPDLGRVEPQLGGQGRDLTQRPFQVLGDVDRQRLQGRHVHHSGEGAHLLSGIVGPVQGIDRDQEPSQGLSRPSRRRDQGVGPGGDQRPASSLGLSRPFREPAQEPFRHRRVKPGDDAGSAGEARRRLRSRCRHHRHDRMHGLRQLRRLQRARRPTSSSRTFHSLGGALHHALGPPVRSGPSAGHRCRRRGGPPRRETWPSGRVSASPRRGSHR